MLIINATTDSKNETYLIKTLIPTAADRVRRYKYKLKPLLKKLLIESKILAFNIEKIDTWSYNIREDSDIKYLNEFCANSIMQNEYIEIKDELAEYLIAIEITSFARKKYRLLLQKIRILHAAIYKTNLYITADEINGYDYTEHSIYCTSIMQLREQLNIYNAVTEADCKIQHDKLYAEINAKILHYNMASRQIIKKLVNCTNTLKAETNITLSNNIHMSRLPYYIKKTHTYLNDIIYYESYYNIVYWLENILERSKTPNILKDYIIFLQIMSFYIMLKTQHSISLHEQSKVATINLLQNHNIAFNYELQLPSPMPIAYCIYANQQIYEQTYIITYLAQQPVSKIPEAYMCRIVKCLVDDITVTPKINIHNIGSIILNINEDPFQDIICEAEGQLLLYMQNHLGFDTKNNELKNY